MTILRVLSVPDPILKAKALPVAVVDASIKKLLNDMAETMYAVSGVGLAANQVGVLKRAIVMDLDDRAPEVGLLKMVNPEIIWQSNDKEINTEGCLSVPGQSAEVMRCKAIKVRYLNEHNELIEREFDEWLAICVQHEIDHLDGILYIDYLSKFKRDLLVKRSQKHQKVNY